MKIPKQERETSLAELVETHNLSLSLKRLENSVPFDHGRWKRALYHALCMNGAGDPNMRTKIREALGLP